MRYLLALILAKGGFLSVPLQSHPRMLASWTQTIHVVNLIERARHKPSLAQSLGSRTPFSWFSGSTRGLLA